MHQALEDDDRTLDSKVSVVEVAHLSREVADIYGVLNLVIKDGTTHFGNCTSGFSVQHSTAGKGIITAKHCLNPWTRNVLYSGTTLQKQTYRYEGSHDVMWAKHSNFTPRNLIHDGSGNRYILGKRGRDQQSVNAWVCKYGITTGYGCSTIRSTTYDRSGFSGNWNATWIRVWDNDGNTSTNFVDGGDSGGPWFNANNAYGITASLAPEGDAVYMAINYIDNLSLSVLTSSN